MKSKAISAVALLGAIVILCVTFAYRIEWWAFIDIFCFFVASFLHLLATFQPPALRAAAHKIDLIAMTLVLVGVAAFIGEGIAFYCFFS